MTPRRWIGSFLGIGLSILLIFGAANAFGGGRWGGPRFQRFSFSLGGGYGFSEGHHGMVDLKSEFQFSFTRNIRLGLGVGYLSSGEGHSHHNEMRDRRGWELRDLMGMGASGQDFEADAPRTTFRIVPLTLNVYGAFPLGRRWDVFMSGGASFNLGSFRVEGDHQNKSAWGGQAGLGAEFRVSRNVLLVAEAGYRFLKFHGLERPVSQTPLNFLRRLLLGTGNQRQNSDAANWLKNMMQSLTGMDRWQSQAEKHFSLYLNGFALRAGLKFSL